MSHISMPPDAPSHRLMGLLRKALRARTRPKSSRAACFGPRVWHNAEEAVESADILLVIGTSAVVYPAASLAPLAKSSGARVIEINVEETPLSASVDCSLRGASGEILPQLIA